MRSAEQVTVDNGFSILTHREDTLRQSYVEFKINRHANYTELDFFPSQGGSSKLAARRRYTITCAPARSFPCSISSTASDGAIQFFALTL